LTIVGNVLLTLTNDTVAQHRPRRWHRQRRRPQQFNGAGTTITVDNGQTLRPQDSVAVPGSTTDNSGTLDIETCAGATLSGVTVTGGDAVQDDGVT
jgi:hypothetical protein